MRANPDPVLGDNGEFITRIVMFGYFGCNTLKS